MGAETEPGAPAVPGVTRWRKRSGEYAEAVQVTLDNIVTVADWISDSGAHCDQYERHLSITEVSRGAALGDWVICYDSLEPCFTVLSADLFAAAYEPAPASAVPLADGTEPADGTWRGRAEAAEAALAAFEAHRPAVLDALRIAVADTAYGSRAGRFTTALDALERSGEETRDA